jgi:hypothetical protein
VEEEGHPVPLDVQAIMGVGLTHGSWVYSEIPHLPCKCQLFLGKWKTLLFISVVTRGARHMLRILVGGSPMSPKGTLELPRPQTARWGRTVADPAASQVRKPEPRA